MENQLITIWQPIAEGTERIEDWWQRNGNLIQSITHVDTEEEVLILSASYCASPITLCRDYCVTKSISGTELFISTKPTLSQCLVHARKILDSITPLLGQR